MVGKDWKDSRGVVYMEANDDDYCDRLPGQHTGRLSLEMQASEAAEWQRSIAELEVMLVAAADTIRRLTSPASPAAGESPGISPEPAQAHGLSEHQLRAIGEAVTALRFCASQNDWYTEARATELRNIANALTGIEIDAAATPSAAVGAEGPGAGNKPFRLEYGKRYVNRVGRVTAPLVKNTIKYCDEHPFYDTSDNTCYQENGRWSVEAGDDEEDLIAGYHEPEPSPPSESPDVSGEIRGLKYALEWIYVKRAGNPHLKAAALEMLNDMQVAYEAAVDRLQDGEAINSTSQIDLPAESPDDWVTQDRVPARPGIDQRAWDHGDGFEWRWEDAAQLNFDMQPMHGYQSGGHPVLHLRCRRKDLPVVPFVTPSLPSPWRPMTDDYPRDKVLWVARDDGLVYTERNPDEWPLAKAIAWMLAVTPVHPNAAPPVVPKTRTVTLREYRMDGESYWTNSFAEIGYTGRIAVVEVPE